MGALSRTEKILMAAAALALAAAVGVSAGLSHRGGIMLSPFTDSAPVQTEEVCELYLDVNSATAEELAALPAIGEVLSQRIVDYRDGHGPFGDVSELTRVEGIGEGILLKIKDYIYAGGTDENTGG